MEKDRYTQSERKALGAFYTPDALADVLAYFVHSINKKKDVVVVDPSTGDSALLVAFYRASQRRRINARYVGVDIERPAVQTSRRIFSKLPVESSFIQTDWLYPCESKNCVDGYEKLKNRLFPSGIDIILSNPPWGAEKGMYISLEKDFVVAKGQFDIYDVFVESIVDRLSNGGCYGIIIPDSIYNSEHKKTRKYLLENTSISHIIRVGEGFFPEVNIAVTLLFGTKGKPHKHPIMCAHLSSEERKRVISGEDCLLDCIKNNLHPVSSQLMIAADSAFLTDIETVDIELSNILGKCSTIGRVATNQRGVELSKKGMIVKCPQCGLWHPLPRKKNISDYDCPSCGYNVSLLSAQQDCIISKKQRANCKKLIVGEDIFRYNVCSKSYIETDREGINYKNENLYLGSKILIRKTGVGITAGIDYEDCLTNQVVYVLKKREDINVLLTNEVILAVLNSRITTYFIIKMFGNNGWKTHAYLTQGNVESLPFPKIDITSTEVCKILEQLTDSVKNNACGREDLFPKEIDAKIERLVAALFGLKKEHYEVIFETIRGVQPMIPFKRLLKIDIEDIFNNGI